MQAGTTRGRRRSTGEVLLFDLVVTAALLSAAAFSIDLGPPATGLMLLLCPVVAGLITGGVSAYNRCAGVSLLVLLVGLAVFDALFFDWRRGWPGEPGPIAAISVWMWVIVSGIELVVGWTIGAVVGYFAQRG